MPNWCENSITITGSQHDLDALWDEIQPKTEDEQYADLTRSFPLPAQHKDDWYNWCNENWGTKWAPEFYYDKQDTEILLWGDSAWSPPVGLLKNVAVRFPNLTFRIEYAEAGCDFVGAAVIQNTKIVESNGTISEHITADEDSDEYFDLLMETMTDLKDTHADNADRLWKVG